jgi:GDP-4-dehydro-6-deoxy-D-mannose reductase
LDTARDFLDVRDVVQAYEMLMRLDSVAGEVYNVCSGRETSIRSIFESFVKMVGLDRLINIKINVEHQDRKFDNAHVVGNNSKLKVSTGWSQVYSLSQTIIDTLDYWREECIDRG